MSDYGNNTGHGWVWKRPDGMVARCGGPTMCKECALDLVRLNAKKDADKSEVESLRAELKDMREALEESISYVELCYDEEGGEEAAEAKITLDKCRRALGQGSEKGPGA